MEQLRNAILQGRGLEARQEIDDILSGTSDVREVLEDLYHCASWFQDETFTTPHGLILVYSLDRSRDEFHRLGCLGQAMHQVANYLSSRSHELPVATPDLPPALPSRSLGEAVGDGDIRETAAFLLGLEDPRRERTVREEFLSIVLGHLGQLGHTLIFANAFQFGFERVQREDRRRLALHAAQYLVKRVRESGVKVEEDPSPLPIPGSPSAGELLARMRDFNEPAASANLDALFRSGRETEALTVLLLRAEEHAGPIWHHLMFADAVRETFPRVTVDQRKELIRRVLTTLLIRDEESHIIENIAEGVPDEPLRSRERNTRERGLADSLVRHDPQAALDCARELLVREEGADRVKKVLVETLGSLRDDHAPHAFIFVTTCLAIATVVGWPAARTPLLRAAYGMASERLS